MSTKLVKVTNGKILNYKISASGYKTIIGSQIITANSTINKTMIAETDPNGVYALGDRIANMATFVCYFNSTNPDTNTDQKYAVFVLDAKYRNNSLAWSNNLVSTGLPSYSNESALFAAKESATYNTDFILNKFTPSDYPAFNWCANIILSSLNISAKLPNGYEVQQIVTNMSTLDSLDPTASSYSSLTLANIGSKWTSNSISDRYAVAVAGVDTWVFNTPKTYTPCSAVPVFEIPVE